MLSESVTDSFGKVQCMHNDQTKMAKDGVADIDKHINQAIVSETGISIGIQVTHYIVVVCSWVVKN